MKGENMITITTLNKMKVAGEKIAMLTCYDATFASVMDQCGVDVLLIGDSLGMVMQGHKATTPVRLEDMCYHTQCVARGVENAMIMTDFSFGSYQQSREQAFLSAHKLMAAGANIVKLEGGEFMAETTHFLQERGVPVCAHIGLTPQSVHAMGGYKVQGKTEEAAKQLLRDAKAHHEAGAAVILMECVPAQLAAEITNSVSCPTIGIGAGVDCDGQVLVMHDMLDISVGKKARFVKNFLQGQNSIQDAIRLYVKEVKDKTFPTLEHSF